VDDAFIVQGDVDIFPQPGGWVYVRVPHEYTEMTEHLAERGLVAVTVQVGTTTWKTSMLPMGDGTQFIALNAKVRKAENIEIGDTVSLTVRLRRS
jgi:hypothetical protein